LYIKVTIINFLTLKEINISGDIMPGFNRTGPRGFGPMTGGGYGLCTGYSSTPYQPYESQQYMMPQLPNIYPNYMQNPYGYQSYHSSQFQPAIPMQQSYYGRFPYDMGGRGLGLSWGRGFGPRLGYGRGLGLGRRFGLL
jgi:hypothetical protein